MKIGVITFFRGNYGAVLQAYALQSILKTLGHSAEVIDYESKSRGRKFLSAPRTSAKLLVLSLFKSFRNELFTVRERLFEDFNKHQLRISDEKHVSSTSLEESPACYDAYLCGSDQVWSPRPDHDRNRVNFLGFVKQESAVKIAYAPSFGVSSVAQSFQQEIKPWIDDIPHLSVREQTGRTIIEQATGRKAEVVLDPTLLLDSEHWNGVAVPPAVEPPYILVYSTSQRGLFPQLVGHIKATTRLPVVVLSLTSLNLISGAGQVIFDAGPREFVSLFANAACVCTNSFHGTAFSIIYRKPFWSVPHNTTNSRMSDLLCRINLSDRQISERDKFPEAPLEIDFTTPVSLLESEKQRSMAFLRYALQEPKPQ